MSRAYRISIKEALNRHVQVEDGISANLELLPILSAERMREILAHHLLGRGFTREGQKASRAQAHGIKVTVDLDTGALDVTAEGHHDVKLELERVRVIDSDRADTEEAKLRAKARTDLETEAAAETDALRQQVTAQLERVLQDVRGELDAVVTQVTADALKQRAAELGTVEAVHEGADGSLTIKVRV